MSDHRLEQAPGGAVRLVLRATVSRAAPEAISAAAIAQEINAMVKQILESAAGTIKKRAG